MNHREKTRFWDWILLGNFEWFCKDKISISTDYLFCLFLLIILIRFWRISNPLQYSKLLRIFNLLKRTGARCPIILSNVNYPYSQNTVNKSCKKSVVFSVFEGKTQNKRVRKVSPPSTRSEKCPLLRLQSPSVFSFFDRNKRETRGK